MKLKATTTEYEIEYLNEVKQWFEIHYSCKFNTKVDLTLNDSPKPHCFDLVSEDMHIVAECRCYSWGKNGYAPSTKLSEMNEAACYLRMLPSKTLKLIVVMRVESSVHTETLAHYYARKNHSMLRDITVMEYNPAAKTMIRV